MWSGQHCLHKAAGRATQFFSLKLLVLPLLFQQQLLWTTRRTLLHHFWRKQEVPIGSQPCFGDSRGPQLGILPIPGAAARMQTLGLLS